MYKLKEKFNLIVENKIILAFVLLLILIFAILQIFKPSSVGKVTYVVRETNVAWLNVTLSPEKPKVSEKFKIETEIFSTKAENFLLEIMVVQKGEVEKYQTYQFSLKQQESTKFSFDYTTISMEKQSIVANLYNSDKTMLYDSKIVEFSAESEIGPFDVETILPTNFIMQGYSLPVKVILKNFGTKSVDVNLVLTVDCFGKNDVSKNTFVYLNASSEMEKDFILPSCNEKGLHEVKASLIAYGGEHVSALSQYFEKEYLQSLDFSVPDSLKIEEGSSHKINLILKNTAGVDLIDVKPIVFGIPKSWFTINPSIIPEMKNGEMRVIIIEFNVPKGSESTYPVLIGASSYNLFSEKTVELRVTGAVAQAPEIEGFKATNFFMILGVALIVALILILKRRKKPKYSYKLGKLREGISES